jgi:protocatechuate 3,4-dioxygenase alpha subunit
LSLPSTPSQTVGPYLSLGLPWPDGPWAADEGTPGAIFLSGRVLDGEGVAVTDALVETWQADPAPRPGFRAFARCPTDDGGRWFVSTLAPGSVPGPGGAPQAPHLDVTVVARGLLHRVVTRLYLPDDPIALAADPVLASVAPERRETLVAVPDGSGGYVFDIRLQGPGETVFFDV